MAEVFEATLQREDGTLRTVALKRILQSLASREDIRKLFVRELEVGALIGHPNIVQVLDWGADEEGPFLVMEFVDGRSLHRLLRSASSRGERLSPAACLAVADQVLRALDHLHTRRDAQGRPLLLVHRDLNPPNVLVSRNGELKVSDFGIARSTLAPRLTASDEMRGKIPYAAPEQIQGAPPTPLVDLFALGVLLIEVALGRHPFEGDSDARLVGRLAAGDYRAPREARTDLPPAYFTLVDRLVEAEPTARLPSAAAGLDLLREIHWDAEAARQELTRLVADERDGRAHERTTQPA